MSCLSHKGLIDGKEKKKRGGLRTMPFILSNEVCDRFAAAGFYANMIQYLRSELHLPLVQATNSLNNFGGTAGFTPVIGAIIADSFAGRFWTITVGSIIYFVGMVGVTISAIIPSLRPPSCPPGSKNCQVASGWQQTFFFVSLMLTAVGAGGTKPCVVAFGAEQLEGPTHGGGAPAKKPGPGPDGSAKKSQSTFFSIYFCCVGISVMLALTVVVYVQDNVGWGLGFAIPTIAMFISVIFFVCGYRLYIRNKPGGSPLTRLAQVIAAAVRKRKLPLPTDAASLHNDKEMDAAISTAGRLSHTNKFRFLDRGAIAVDGDNDAATGHPNHWRLSTVHRVEELKCILSILPIWSAGILIATATSNNYTMAIVQSKSMNRRLSSQFEIPAASLYILSSASTLLTLLLYDRVVLPLARRRTSRQDPISNLRRIGIGLAISIFSNVAAAITETRRRNAAGNISAFWLAPQYVIHGISEGFASVGLMEFLYDQSPESMRSIAAALYWLSISLGHYGGTLLVTLVSNFSKHLAMGTGGDGGWIQDDLDDGKLDYYYWLVVVMQVFNLVYFIICAKLYVYKKLEVPSADEEMKAVAGSGGKTADAIA